jgi:DNA-binding MarR family transcriptional regulator
VTALRSSRFQHRILVWLAQEAQRTRGTMSASPQDLRHTLGTDKSNLSHSLGNLAAKGLVRITRTAGEKAEAIDLTPAGRREDVNKSKVVLTRPTKRWQERLAELCRHIAAPECKDLSERLAETWSPEVHAGCHRELGQLIE